MSEIKMVRIKLGLTRSQVAMAAQKTVSTIQRWEEANKLPRGMSHTGYVKLLREGVPAAAMVRNRILGVFTLGMARHILGLTREDFARQLDVSVAYMRKLESNERRLTLVMKHVVAAEVRMRLTEILKHKDAH
ncbi:MAG: hypothetical protein RLZZ234_441 [Candidatus Parcubacteria bacterium]|jgi:DNA-binding transcriptional regulator YiaG